MLKKYNNLSTMTFLVILSTVILVSIMLVLSSCGVTFLSAMFDKDYEDSIIETHNVNDFFDETYLEYNGGKAAKVFFDEFAYTDNYIDIAFHYKDGEKGSYLMDSYYKHTVFALDVYYDRDTFLEVSNNILLEITGEKAEDIFKLYDGKQMVAFSGYKIEKEDSVYKENNAAVLFDPRYNTIRYAFLCNNTDDVFAVEDATFYVLNVKTNFSDDERGWVFDYSDIASEDYTSKYT